MNLRLAGVSALIVAAFITVGAVKFQYAAAQVDATSTEAAVTTSESVVPTTDGATSTTENPITETSITASAEASASTSGFVEVQLRCSQSYTTDVYDTPSGRPDPYVKPEVATTTDTIAHVIKQQSYTVCHDAQGHVHEFPITADEYAALLIRGTPQKSVMEPADDAALDSFRVEATDAPAADAGAPAVLGASTSANPESPDTSSASTTSTPSPSADTDSSYAPTTADLPFDTTAPATTSEDATTPPSVNDDASEAATDTPSI